MVSSSTFYKVTHIVYIEWSSVHVECIVYIKRICKALADKYIVRASYARIHPS